MNVGSIIKHHRVKQAMTQKELCEGICSISHLSKIENNSKEVNRETLNMLLERLHIKLEDEENNHKLLEKRLSDFMESILFQNKERSTKIFEELKVKEEYIYITDMVNTYLLYVFRYHIFMANFNEALKFYKILKKLSNNFSQHENYLFQCFYAVYCLLEGGSDFRPALKTLKSLYTEFDKVPTIIHGELLYYLSNGYFQANNFYKASFFISEGLKLYGSQFNFARIVHSQVLLANCYTLLGLFDQASKMFDIMLNNSEFKAPGTEFYYVFHNYGFFLKETKQYVKAIEYYKRAMKFSPAFSYTYYMSLTDIAECFYHLNDISKSLSIFKSCIHTFKDLKFVDLYLISNFYIKLIGDYDSAMTFLEDELLPYCFENSLFYNIVNFSHFLQTYYENKLDFEKAYKYKKYYTEFNKEDF